MEGSLLECYEAGTNSVGNCAIPWRFSFPMLLLLAFTKGTKLSVRHGERNSRSCSNNITLPPTANLVLQSTTERIFATNPASLETDRPTGIYADVSHGIFLVRGENVLLLGEIDLDKDDDPPPGFEPAELELVKRLAEEKKAEDKVREKARLKKLAKLGFEGENLGEILL